MKYLLPTLFLLFISIEAQSQCVSGNCQNGKGIFIFTSGAKYVGTFSNGEANGNGSCYYPDGTIYKGEWHNRFPDGQGEKILSDGTKWSGTWNKGVPVDASGSPVYFKGIEDTGIQTGCLSGNCVNGKGIIAYSDGSKYIGHFKNSKLNGSGKWFYPNGDIYTGYFKNNLADGQGILVTHEGKTITGRWKNGEYKDADKLASKGEVGCLSGNCINGEGEYIYDGGIIKYVGSFRNGFPEGDGICYFGGNKSYKGEWKHGKFNGFGIFTKVDGTVVKGWWKDGSFISPKKEKDRDTNTKEASEINVWAVVIGIAAYPHMPVLKYTDNDAYEMYAFLKSPEGGALKDDHIKVLIDDYATKENITKTLEEIYGKAGPNDLVMMYYSGHGLKGSFLPVDYDGTNNKLEHREINDILKKCKAKYKIIIADACHSGSYLAMRGISSQSALINYYKSLAQAEPGTALIMSSKSEENSLESNGLRHGVFSHFLIRGLKGEADVDGDNIVSIQELYNFININVRSYTANMQSPVILGDYDSNMTIGVVRR